MDISQFASGLLGQSETYLREWFPSGKKRGREFMVGSLAGEPGESLSINLETGLWADFSNPDIKGGDLVSLYAARHGLGQYEAAKTLGYLNGATPPVDAPVKPLQAMCEPIPTDAPPLPGMPPSAVYSYRDATGVELFRIARYEPAGERKTFKPWTWRNNRWSAKAYPAPRPLYGLELLGDRPVLLVEGEKACDAARQLLGRAYACMTWAGGAAAVGTVDWSPLYGKVIDIWPDADKPGNEAAAKIVEHLLPHVGGGRIRILLQDGQPDGWDLADALADGWDTKRLIEHVKREGGVRVVAALQVGRPHDGKPAIEHKPDMPVAADNERSVRVWHEQLGLQCSSSGPYSTESNAQRVLLGHPLYAGKIWLNEFSQELMLSDRPFERIDAINALMFMQTRLELHKLPLQAIERAALAAGNINKRHPVREWLDSLKWDGIERLTSLMPDGFGTPRNAYTESVGRCWLVSMVARIYQPGCQADYMPVFEGRQGIYKSSAMRAIGGEWFMESHEDPIHNRKDFLQALQGHWLIEIPEMHTIAGRGNGIEKIKGIITNRVDSYREPYGVRVRPYPRQCIFAGTTNHDQWNPDSTGGRRFWPIACGQIELGWIRDSRDQLFAEAVSQYRATGDWYSVPQDLAQAEQDARRETDAWEDIVLPYLNARPTSDVTLAGVLRDALGIEAGHWKQTDQNRVARILRANGWYRKQLKSAGKPMWVYRNAHRNDKPVAIQTDKAF
jgi:predicted P-loop ATPase